MKFKSINFTCKHCGAPLRFSPIHNSLDCEFCGTQESIEESVERIKEYDLQEALAHLKHHHEQEISKEVSCSKCAATFNMTPYSVSSNCPYCGTPAITNFVKEITPKSLLPFHISEKKAHDLFKKWIGSLWLAPSKLKKFFESNQKLKGYYLPYWTYDADTYTNYHGQRGDIYYVQVQKTVMVDGRQERRTVQESRIRWTPVSGHVSNSFDDITIGASKTISNTILDNLSPWHTEVLVPFNPKYLSGFDSEEYTIGLDNGFELAKVKMTHIIRQDIRDDIGGDQQQISHLSTQYNNTSYKNVLFPIWTAEFKWKNKMYNYAINGQTGKVTGERPYSWLKIAAIVGTLSGGAGGAVYVDQHPEVIQEIKSISLEYLG
ncbi:MAG: Primosomal protein N' (replication factor Y) -superfamily II helicase [uncultured Sulfurovum sp.]|uniref:Primosomal protein N' (Replication factor Y) -superfamily II helicase n=1 Tax=uncultured Sulfurovum sp. TaxID=269237 RepID=A0A6S6SJR6_9BACT|nr:MAG: Primosomal protein N' (replication factor Y) -superfamily II helicase [uncultured Sulfurovum sp.]